MGNKLQNSNRKTQNYISNIKSKNVWRGFTLIELLVVIAIIGILIISAAAVLNPQLQFKKARDARRKADLGKIQSALELYRSDNGSYAAALSTLTSGTTIYLQSVPTDPKNTGPYTYTYTRPSASTYTITACLEAVNASTSTCDAAAVYTVRQP